MSLRAFILENVWLKVVSLFLASLIWFAIQSSQSGSRFPSSLFHSRVQTLEMRCPVSILSSPRARPALTLEPASVLVKVRGDEATLKKLASGRLQPYVRAEDVADIKGVFRVEIVVPPGITLQEIVPEHVTVQSAPPAANTSAQVQ
jgi:hypothetical protein